MHPSVTVVMCYKYSPAVAERPRDTSCLSAVSFDSTIRRAQYAIKLWSHSIPTKSHGNIPTATPLTGASNAGAVGRNRDSGPISGSIAGCEPFHWQVQYT